MSLNILPVDQAVQSLQRFYPVNSNKEKENIVRDLIIRIRIENPDLGNTSFSLKKGNETVEARFKNCELTYFNRHGNPNSTELFTTLSPELIKEEPASKYQWSVESKNSELDKKAVAAFVFTVSAAACFIYQINPLNVAYGATAETASLIGRCASAAGSAMISTAGLMIGTAVCTAFATVACITRQFRIHF